MSKFEDGSYSSLPGVALIGKVLAGRCKMHYTRAAVGKGHIPEGVSPKEVTEPPDYVMDAMIAAVTNPVNGECQVTVQINSSDVEHGFYCTGVLLYAEDPDDGNVPYTYLRLEDGPEWIRPKTSIVGKLATFDLIAAVGDVDAVTATIDPQSIVTREVVTQMIADATAVLEVTIPKENWERTEESRYPFCLDIPIANVTEAMMPMLIIWPECMEAAGACGMSPLVRTVQGGIRVYAEEVPAETLQGTLTLFGVSGMGKISGEGGGAYALPIATATRLGAVRIKEGSGLIVDDSGNLAIDAATEQEIADVLSGSAAGTTQ